MFGKELKLPVITNRVLLEKDSELILYMEPLVKRKQPKAKAAPPRKRARQEVKRVPKEPAVADSETE